MAGAVDEYVDVAPFIDSPVNQSLQVIIRLIRAGDTDAYLAQINDLANGDICLTMAVTGAGAAVLVGGAGILRLAAARERS